MIALVVGLGLFVAGCATKPSYVGTWKCQNMPAEAQEEGATAANLYIAEEGGIFLITEGSVKSASGRWETNKVGGINVVFEGQDDGTGQLLDKDTLLIAGGGVAMKFIRQ